MNKVCGKCNLSLSIEDFNKKSKLCKSCQKIYNKEYYSANSIRCIEQNNVRAEQRRKEKINKVFEFFKTHPCIDCGESNPIVLEFDHVRGIKKQSISRMITCGRRWDLIEEEMAKCDVRCVNCHRIKTAKDFGWNTYLNKVPNK